MFRELELAETPYITPEENRKVQGDIFARLGAVKAVVFASEDGEEACPMEYFLEVLANYRFQENEVAGIREGDIWLADGDSYVVAKF
jgi:hypothetical protein